MHDAARGLQVTVRPRHVGLPVPFFPFHFLPFVCHPPPCHRHRRHPLDAMSRREPTGHCRGVDRGVQVALVTGRGFTFARPVAEQLDLPVVLVASNGAVVRSLDGTTILRRLMPLAVARDVLAQTAGYRAKRQSCSTGLGRASWCRAVSIGRIPRGRGATDDTARSSPRCSRSRTACSRIPSR